MKSKKVISGFIWRLLERFGAQGVSIVVSLILARLLDPVIYGMVALVSVIITILQVFIDSGFGTALIQKEHVDDLDFSSVFYFNIVVCFLLYIALFISAPLIGEFYELPELTLIVRVLGLTLIISGVKNILQAYVSRYMLFKRFFIASIGGTIGAAIVGISMAYHGYGVWALVMQGLFNNLVNTVILWIAVKWRPKLSFSFKRLKVLYTFAWKLLVSRLFSTIYSNLRQLIIGKFYTKEDLAYYNRGNEFPGKIVPNIEIALNSVLLPTMSAEQKYLDKVCSIMRKGVRTTSFLIWPAMMGLAACGEVLTRLLLTEKWLPSVIYMQIFCFEYAFWPMSAVYNNAIQAIGRSDISLRIQLFVRSFGIVILLFSIREGVLVIAITSLIVTLIEFIILSLYVKRHFNYNYVDQLKDFVPTIILSVFMGICVFFIGYINISSIMILFLQVDLGVIIFIVGSKLLRLEGFNYIKVIIFELIKKQY